jgi:hypothetical protein
MSKLEFANDSEQNNYLISFSLINEYVKIQKIIKIELKKFNKTIENVINDLAEKTNELEDNNNKLQSQIKILEEKNTTFEILLKKQETTFNDEIKSLKDIITELQTKLNKPIDNAQTGFKSNLPNFTQPNYTQQSFTQPNFTQQSFTQPNFTQSNFPSFTQVKSNYQTPVSQIPTINNVTHQNPAINNVSHQNPAIQPPVSVPVSVANPALTPALAQPNCVLAQNVPTFKFGM